MILSVGALEPDYDADPGRWAAWKPSHDVHDVVAPELHGLVLDVGCGEGRLASLLSGDDVTWVGVDLSPAQVEANTFRPVVLADMRALPFRAGVFQAVTHLWCLYHVDDPTAAVAEAHRVLAPGGRYYACTNARNSDPELMWEGYPATSFDAEDAVEVVAEVFAYVEDDRWDAPMLSLESREEVRAFCRQHFIPTERADGIELPLWLTKCGVLIRATRQEAEPRSP